MTKKTTPGLLAVPFLAAAVLAGLAVPVLLPFISTSPQIYKDIILEYVSLYNLNKSGELRLLYGLIAVSAAMLILWHYFAAKREITGRETKCAWNDKIILLLFVPSLFNFLYFSVVNGYLLLAAAFALCLAAYGLLTYRHILLMVVLYFALMAVRAMTRLNSAPPHIQVRMLCLTALLFAVILLAERYNKKAAWLAIVFPQILVPFVLLYFLRNLYNLDGELATVTFDPGYRYFVRIAVAAAVLHALFSAGLIISKKWRGLPALNDLILPTTVISIFVFNNVNSPQPFLHDWHHAAEIFVPFQQVVEFGKTLYGDFLSASGCYPMVFGFAQRFFLANTAASYFQAETLIYILACAASGVLLIYAFGKKCALFIALSIGSLLPWVNYPRALFLLPCLLILMIPRIASNRHLWLQIYILCSMLLGLVYPLYGGAYLLGALPFAIVQARNILKQPLSDKRILFGWCVLAVIALFFSPLLLRMARHFLMMASQTLLADGIALFGLDEPGRFFNWTNKHPLNRILYHCTVYGLHIFCLLMPLSLSVIYLINYEKQDKYTGVQFLALSFGALLLPVIYSYTLVRLNHDGFLSRTAPPFAALSVVLLGALWRYGGLVLTRKSILVCFSGLLTLNYVFIAMPQPHAEKLFTPPMLDHAWRLASEDLQARFPRLGAVFLKPRDIEHLYKLQARLEKIRGIPAPVLDMPNPLAAQELITTGRAGVKIYTTLGQLGYFLFDKEASVTGTTYILKSTPAQQAAIRIMEKNPPICFGMDSFVHYVLYRWMMDSDYIFSDGVALPKNQAGPASPDAVPDYSMFFGFDDLGQRANALGKSMSSLRPLFAEQHIPWQAQAERGNSALTLKAEFERNIAGREVDFIFIDLAHHDQTARFSFKKFFRGPRLIVRAAWAGADGVFEEKNSMEMTFGNGKLLLPLGANPWWLTGEARKLRLEISGELAEGESVPLNEVKFLQFKPTARADQGSSPGPISGGR
jgi:hypothetical protein